MSSRKRPLPISSQGEAVTGFAVGVFQDLEGMATKPMVGCLDAVTHTGEAMREMAGGLTYGDAFLATRRSRFPWLFGLDRRMIPRTEGTACGALLLARFPLLKACLWTAMHLRICLCLYMCVCVLFAYSFLFVSASFLFVYVGKCPQALLFNSAWIRVALRRENNLCCLKCRVPGINGSSIKMTNGYPPFPPPHS